MSARTAIVTCLLGVLILVGAGISAWRAGPNPETICTRGADKVILCIARHSRSAADMSRTKRDEGIPVCMEDPAKVSMYRECLAHDDCEAFMKCATQSAP